MLLAVSRNFTSPYTHLYSKCSIFLTADTVVSVTWRERGQQESLGKHESPKLCSECTRWYPLFYFQSAAFKLELLPTGCFPPPGSCGTIQLITVNIFHNAGYVWQEVLSQVITSATGYCLTPFHQFILAQSSSVLPSSSFSGDPQHLYRVTVTGIAPNSSNDRFLLGFFYFEKVGIICLAN